MIDGLEILLPQEHKEPPRSQARRDAGEDREKSGFDRILRSSQAKHRVSKAPVRDEPETCEKNEEQPPRVFPEEKAEDASLVLLDGGLCLAPDFAVPAPVREEDQPLDTLNTKSQAPAPKPQGPEIFDPALDPDFLAEPAAEDPEFPKDPGLSAGAAGFRADLRPLTEPDSEIPNPAGDFPEPETASAKPSDQVLYDPASVVFLGGPVAEVPPEAPDPAPLAEARPAEEALAAPQKPFLFKTAEAEDQAEEPKDPLSPGRERLSGGIKGPNGLLPEAPVRIPAPTGKLFSPAMAPELSSGAEKTEKKGSVGPYSPELNGRLSSMMKDVLADLSSLGPGAERNYGPLIFASPGLPQPEVLLQRGPEGLSHGVLNVIRFLQSNGEVRAQIVVEPPSLGRIEVAVHAMPAGNLEASFQVENAALRDMIRSQLPLLQDLLAQAGINVSEMSVDVRSGDGENRRWQGGRSAKSRRIADLDLVDELEQAVPMARLDLEQGLLLWIA